MIFYIYIYLYICVYIIKLPIALISVAYVVDKLRIHEYHDNCTHSKIYALLLNLPKLLLKELATTSPKIWTSSLICC